jgi:hypothetical protein
MYCGSCLRDNALAAELKRQGHDITLLPLYTPTRTDEANVSEPKVFLNGISVCLDQEAAFFRGSHKLLDRLRNAPWMLKLASRTSIRVDPHRLGAMTVSMLRGEEGHQRKEIRQLTAWLLSAAPPDIRARIRHFVDRKKAVGPILRRFRALDQFRGQTLIPDW